MNGIDKLFQLKYLSLRGTNMSETPSGIVRLYDLETLHLKDNDIEELPYPELLNSLNYNVY